MINSNGGSCGAADAGNEKQISGAPKKMALKDVQNENIRSFHKQQESLLPRGGRPNDEALKVSGTKRPSSSQLSYQGTNENIMNANRRFDLELGRGRLQNSMERFTESKNIGRQLIPPIIPQLKHNINLGHVPVASASVITTIMSFPSISSSVHSASGTAKNSPLVNRDVDSKNSGDYQLRADRFFRLQNFLKQCDEYNNKEHVEMLLRMPSSELSKRAVDLEKRAIQLTIDEGKEIERMKSLGILAKASSSSVIGTRQSLT